MSRLQRYFISGLLVWLPIWVTVVVIKFLLDFLNKSISLMPPAYQPDVLLGVHIPGIGVLITLTVILFTGLIAANFIGRRVLSFWDRVMARIPLVRTIYMGVKQVSQTVLTPGGQSFRKVFLVEYPRVGMWTLAFQTGETSEDMRKAIQEPDMVSLFVPTTPNPTSGFILMVARHQVREVDFTVDQALKFVISLGVMQPKQRSSID